MASPSTDITPTTVLVALVVIGILSLMLMQQMTKKVHTQENQHAAQSNKRLKREKKRTNENREQSSDYETQRTQREAEHEAEENEKERIKSVIQKMTMTFEQVKTKTPEQKKAFTIDTGRLGFAAMVLEKMKETITSAEIQKIGLEICIDLATSHDDVASAVADIGVAAYAVSAAIEHAEGHRSVCSTAEKCLSSIASGSSTTGAASGVW